MKEQISQLGNWAKENMVALIGLSIYTIVVYVLLLLDLLPQYNETNTTNTGEKFFPLIVLVGVIIYALLDIRSDKYKEAHKKQE